jgi:hypothetical protein
MTVYSASRKCHKASYDCISIYLSYEFHAAQVEEAAYFRIRHGSQEIGGLFRLPTFPLLASLPSVGRLIMINFDDS